MKRSQRLRGLLVLAPAVLGISMSAGPKVHDFRNPPYRRVDLQQLGNFPFDELNGTEKDIPEQLRKLDGKRVVLKGIMWDVHQEWPGVKMFQLVWNLRPDGHTPPVVQDRVFVYAASGQPVSWVDSLVFVRGTLHVHIRRDETGCAREVYSLTEPAIGLVPPPPPREPSDAWVWGLLGTVALALLSIGKRFARVFAEYSERRRLRSGWFWRKCGYDLRASTVRCGMRDAVHGAVAVHGSSFSALRR